MINYDSERGISVTTTPGRRTHSQLSIQKADVSDSGNYTCAPSSALPASIHVFVSGTVINLKMLLYISRVLRFVEYISSQIWYQNLCISSFRLWGEAMDQWSQWKNIKHRTNIFTGNANIRKYCQIYSHS